LATIVQNIGTDSASVFALNFKIGVLSFCQSIHRPPCYCNGGRTLQLELLMSYTGSKFYCHPCAERLALLGCLNEPTSAPSTFQVDKAEKHTRPLHISSGLHSVLRSGSTSEYEHLGKRAVEAGILEFEPSGVRTLIYPTTSPIGTVYRAGSPDDSADFFRWVLSTDSARAHGYPVPSSDYVGITCASCATALTS